MRNIGVYINYTRWNLDNTILKDVSNNISSTVKRKIDLKFPGLNTFNEYYLGEIDRHSDPHLSGFPKIKNLHYEEYRF